MGFLQIIAISFALSMDAFAVSICQGIRTRGRNYKKALAIGLFFGGFQALMPIIGYFLGDYFHKFIMDVDHWIAFGLLAFIGGKMVYESVRSILYNGTCSGEESNLDLRELVLLSVATSIDAMAVGITFGVLKVGILIPALSIGIITFAMSFFGVIAGNKLGEKTEIAAEILGGLVLIGIGIKILVEHLSA